MVCLLRLLCSEFFDIFNCWQEVTCYLNWCLVFVMYKPSINMNFNLNWSQVEVKLLTREIDVWFKRLSLYSQSLSTSLEAGLWGGLRYSYFTCIPVPYVADLLTMKNWAQTVTKKSLRQWGTDETFHIEKEGGLRQVTLYFVREL